MEKSKKENISIGKISELLKNAPTDDGTFYGCLYDLYVLIGIVKGVSDINNVIPFPLLISETPFDNSNQNI